MPATSSAIQPTLISFSQDFIIDIDGIQAHGMLPSLEFLPMPGSHATGVGAADITKLKANGYYTVAVSSFISGPLKNCVFDSHKQSVYGATRKTLLKVKGFSEVKVEKIKEAIAKCLVIFQWHLSLSVSRQAPVTDVNVAFCFRFHHCS